MQSDGLPSSVINISLQLATDRGRNPVRQPHIAKQPVVSFLVQDQLAIAPKTGVHLSVSVQIGRKMP